MAASRAADPRAQALVAQGDQLFSRRASLMSHWQDVAEQFYPIRADFTVSRAIGDEFVKNLTTSYPLLMHRELGGSFSAMLRRQDQEWFKMSVDDAESLDNSGKQWLEWATGTQRRAMYDRQAQFVRATKEGDMDFAAFGQCVISIERNRRNMALLYRCWHLRDVAWREAEDGSIADRHHNLKVTATWLANMFGPDKLHHRVQECFLPGKNPHQEFNCRRIVMPADQYDGPAKKGRHKWVSIYVDIDNQHIIDEIEVITPVYVIPRWQTNGTQYAFSPAVVAALPDARLLQAMTLTLLEAGEMSVRPPLISVGTAIKGGVQLYAGGITEVDAAYDERLGEVLRPISQDKTGLPFGMEFAATKESMLLQAFYISKLRAMPQKELTAYEASIWAQQWIRDLLPLFEPLETEYNAAVCEQTFDELMIEGTFGSPFDMPQSLRGRDLRFVFQSPLSEAIERQKGQKFMEAKELIVQAMELDPSVRSMLDVRKGSRDALSGQGTPAAWVRSEEEVEAHAQEMADAQAEAAETERIKASAEAGQAAGDAAKSLQEAA